MAGQEFGDGVRGVRRWVAKKEKANIPIGGVDGGGWEQLRTDGETFRNRLEEEQGNIGERGVLVEKTPGEAAKARAHGDPGELLDGIDQFPRFRSGFKADTRQVIASG